MNMPSMLKRLCAGVATAVMALALVTPAYADTTTSVKVVNHPSTVTVHVLDNTNATKDPGDGDGTEIDTSDFGDPIKDVTVKYVKVGELVSYTSGTTTKTAYAISESAASTFSWDLSSNEEVTISGAAYRIVDASELTNLISGKSSNDLSQVSGANWTESGASDDQGAITVSSLSGVYLFIGATMPSNVTESVAPFFLSAPVPTKDGANWNTAIHVYPKLQTSSYDPTIPGGNLHVDMKVGYSEGDLKDNMSANSNTALTYQMSVKIPANAYNFKTFSIEVPNTTGLTLNENPVTSVKLGETTLTATTDYTVSTNDSKLTVALTETGLAKITEDHAEENLVVTYGAKLNDSMSLASAVTSTATLTFQFNTPSAAVNTNTDSATVWAYGIDLTKTFKNADTYPQTDAEFTLYTDAECKNAVNVTGDNGVYWVTSTEGTTAMAVVKNGQTANGTLQLKGLAEGTYYLKETKAPEDYTAASDPIVITVTKGSDDSLATAISAPTGTVNDATATIEGGLVKLTVENAKAASFLEGLLPKTGGYGAAIATIAGLGLACVALIMIFGGVRKNNHAQG